VFQARFIAAGEVRMSYDALPDDRAFVIIRAVGGIDKSHVNVVQNWTEELKAKVPGSRSVLRWWR
jgi:hypothetical protein